MVEKKKNIDTHHAYTYINIHAHNRLCSILRFCPSVYCSSISYLQFWLIVILLCCISVNATCAMVTTMIRLRFDGRSTAYQPPSVWPHLFCGAGHEKRRGEQLKWSWYLGCTSEVSFSMCTATRTSS